MVEIVNPQDAVRAVDLDLKLSRIRNKWLRVCGPCDAGLPGTCTHPNEDYRTVIADLITDLEKFRGNAQLLSASTMGEAFDRLEELVGKEKELDAAFHVVCALYNGVPGAREAAADWVSRQKEDETNAEQR